MTRDDEAEDTSPASLWEEAKDLLRWLVGVFGTPRALIAEAHLSRKERRDILFWLRPVEELIRRLLVVEAARIAQSLPPVKERKRRPAKWPPPRVRHGRAALPDLENSASWSVRFALLGPSAARPAGVPERLLLHVRDLETHADVLAPAQLALAAARHRERCVHNPADEPGPQRAPMRPKISRAAGNPWRLARRIEAAIRVLENPGPYARRLARRLKQDAARIVETCRPPPERAPGERPRFGDGPVRFANQLALRALAPFDTS